MTSLIYDTGTATVEYGSAIVEGNLTGWAVALVSGGLFSCAGVSIPILSVESDTALTLAYPWPGADASGKPYAIARDTSEATRAAWTNDRLATIIQRLSLVGIHPDGSGTLTERDALDPVPAAGYLWLYAEAGHDFAFYRKTASGWDGPFAVRGGKGTDGIGSGGYGVPLGGNNGQALVKTGAGDGATGWAARREVLAANRTYYVNGTTGNNNNNGLSSGAAFATLQKAWDIICSLDLGTSTVTVSVADGTYAGFAINKSPVGGARVIFDGNPAAPSNVAVSSVNTISTIANFDIPVRLQNMKIGATGGDGIAMRSVGTIEIGDGLMFDTVPWAHLRSNLSGGVILRAGNYSIVGGGQCHANAVNGGMVNLQNAAITLVGTPAFSVAFAAATLAGLLNGSLVTFTGGATGPRYKSDSNGIITTSGGGPNYFPGNSAGSVANGGLYL